MTKTRFRLQAAEIEKQPIKQIEIEISPTTLYDEPSAVVLSVDGESQSEDVKTVTQSIQPKKNPTAINHSPK